MDIEESWRRLEVGQFWREVDMEHNRIIANELIGCKDILDIGCGYGSLVSDLLNGGFCVVGIDLNKDHLVKGKELFSNLEQGNLQAMRAEDLGFHGDSFDAVVLRDCMHHLYQEGNVNKALSEIERILKPGGVLVIFDPQPNVIVLMARWIIRHDDAQCNVQEAGEILKSRKWEIRNQLFTEFFALPISGGYVGYVLVPPIKLLYKYLIKANRLFSELINNFAIGRNILWRYVLVAQFVSSDFNQF